MRFVMLVKANKDSEAGVLPSKELLAEMGKYNEEMAKAGVMLAGEGLQASSKGARVSYSGNKRTVMDGPFPETSQLVAGFWIIQVKSKAEAIDWATRVPFREGVVEIRQVFEASDFPPDIFPPEEAAREEALRQELQRKAPAPSR
jgi:hypothetical protein